MGVPDIDTRIRQANLVVRAVGIVALIVGFSVAIVWAVFVPELWDGKPLLGVPANAWASSGELVAAFIVAPFASIRICWTGVRLIRESLPGSRIKTGAPAA